MRILGAFLAVLLVQQSVGINLTYIVKKEGDKLQPNCIAEENERYSAIGWVYPLPKKEENLPNITTKYVPTIPNSFNCKFSKNGKCNKVWTIKDWEIDANSTRTLDLILDSRWEDFPAVFTGNGKEFKERVEIPNVFRAGFSLRTDSGVELLICEGWNPYNYPCYHLNISKTEIFLRKYAILPQNLTSGDRFLNSYKSERTDTVIIYGEAGQNDIIQIVQHYVMMFLSLQFGEYYMYRDYIRFMCRKFRHCSQAFANILSGDEWRNFVINLDKNGILSLNDVNLNRTVIQYEDKKALKPLYLLLRSDQPALWKIHQNQFFFSKTAQISRMGPELNLASKDLCVAFYVSTCPNCAMTFTLIDGTKRKILKDVEPTQEHEWRLVTLQTEQILSNKVYLFVETRFVNRSPNQTEGFWALDDIRVCHENEVKVSFLKLKNDDNVTDDVSCQVVRHPKWRPKKLIYSKIEDFPKIDSSANSTSISLNWTQEDPNYQINYFITYQANDLCVGEPSVNLRRVKSNGFLMTKHNEITINNLIPFTKYNITFSSMLHEKERKMSITTLETDIPTPEELPNRLQIQTTDSVAYVSWDKIGCASRYGHIIYSIQIINTETSMFKEVGIQSENTVTIRDLKPYTLYIFNITTARSYENVENNKASIGMLLNFTTKAGLAPAPENLELYSISNDSASFRYDLPKKPTGKPVGIQIMRCNSYSSSKCKSSIQKIGKCELWPGKYCFDIKKTLIANQPYTFKISMKNEGTNFFGNDSVVEGVAKHQVPAPPSNITYRFVDCGNSTDRCNLNISWSHPYYQNGTITAFNLILNSTENDSGESIQEIFKIVNNTYSRIYEHQIKFIPYSSHYELYLQSVNSIYKSAFANIHVKTENIGEHINQKPTLQDLHPNSAVFTLPSLDHRLTSYTLTAIVQDFDNKKTVPREILRKEKISDHICHKFGNTWILPKIRVTNASEIEKYTIGTGENSNKFLEANTKYCITFIVTNEYKNTEHDVVYYKKLETPGASPTTPSTDAPTTSSGSKKYNHLYILLLLLLLVPIGFLVYRYFKKRRSKPSQRENQENVYESLPFEECEENCVNNETYDQLLHK